MGGDWLFSIKSRHSIVKGFIVRAPRHLYTLRVDGQLDGARCWVRLTTTCLVGITAPRHVTAGWTGFGRLGPGEPTNIDAINPHPTPTLPSTQLC